MRATVLLLLLTSACVAYTPRPLDPQANATAIQQRTVDDPAVRAYAEKTLGRTFAQWPPAQWDLDTLTAVAFYFNPEIAVARAEHASAAAAIETARERPNPTASASIEHKSDPQLSPWVTNFGIDIPIELPSKRGARIDQAQQNAAAFQARVAVSAWSIRSRLRARLVDVYGAREHLAALQRERHVQNEIVEMFAKRVELGEAAQQELSRARIALTQIDLLERDAQRTASLAATAMPGIIGIPSAAFAGTSFTFDKTPSIDDSLRDVALTGRPDVLAALHDYASADAALRMEVARQFPDIHLSPAFGWDQGARTWTLGALGEIPLFNRHRGPIGEATARREEAAARVTAVQASVISAFDEAKRSFVLAQEKLRDAGNLVAAQQQQFAKVQKQFDAGEIDRLALRTAELELANAELARADALIAVQEAVGAVEDSLQRPLSGKLTGDLKPIEAMK